MPFCSVEYEKILHFISLIQEKNTDFRYHVLKSLSSLFSFNHITFFLINQEDNLTNPIGLNINNNSFYLYNQHYFKTDIFHPINLPAQFIYSRSSYSVEDLMTFEKFEKTEYYNDFLKRQNLYHEIAIPLKHNNQLIGALGVFRPKEEDFTEKEVHVLNKLSNYIACSLQHYLETANLKWEQQYANNIITTLPIGLVMLDSNFNIVHHNEMAYSYCSDIFSDFSHYNPVEPVIKKALTKTSFNNINSSTQTYISMQNYSFTIVPFLLPTKKQKLQTYYHVYITKSTPPNNTIHELVELYNLTEREMDLINLVALGLNNQEIADKLYISYNTVRTHLDNIRKKLGVKNRTAILHKFFLLQQGKNNINQIKDYR